MNRIIKLKEIKGFAYYITSITEDQYNNLKEEMTLFKRKGLDKHINDLNINISSIEALGDSHVSEEFLREYIEFKKIKELSDKHENAFHAKGQIIISAKCYALSIQNKNIISHYDCKSSWNCLMDTMGQPKLLLIYKQLL
jgi:hypothetical protein